MEKKMNKLIIRTIIGILLMITAESLTAYGAELPLEEAVQETEENLPEPDTEIIFDADAVKNKAAVKSALADMHGIFVFRSAFIQQEEIVKKAEKENRESIENMVLLSSQPKPGYQEWVELVLTADTEKYIKDVYIEEEDNNLFTWIYCIIFSICLLCLAIRIEDYIKKNRKNKEKERINEKQNIYNYADML